MGHHDLFGTMHVESTGHIQQMETIGKFNQIQDRSLQPRVNRSYTDQWSEYKLFWLKFGHAHANLCAGLHLWMTTHRPGILLHFDCVRHLEQWWSLWTLSTPDRADSYVSCPNSSHRVP